MIRSAADFKKYVSEIQGKDGFEAPLAFGLGVRRFKGDKTLDATFPCINFKSSAATAAIFYDVFGFQPGENGCTPLKKIMVANHLCRKKAQLLFRDVSTTASTIFK